MKRRVICGTILGTFLLVAGGWSAPGHRVISRIALSLSGDTLPAWLLEADVVERIAYQSNEPDRWRGIDSAALSDENNPDHYIDVELLDGHGLSLDTLPPVRYRFVAALARTGEPEQDVAAFKSSRVGFLPYAIAEHHAKLVSSFNTLRVLEALDDPARGHQIEAARANIVREMGQLSHFVGDASQPLHTTIHHHGWVGDNPDRYTTEGSIHSRIDGKVVALHALNEEALAPFVADAAEIEPGGAFEAGVALITRSHAALEPLYVLERDGTLDGAEGRAFIAERLADGAAVLGGLYRAAWIESEPTAEQIELFGRYNSLGAEAEWRANKTP